MGRYVAFLRGMNQGKRRIQNDELCSHFKTLGCKDVSAFLASGNVMFTSGERGDLAAHLSQGLEKVLGYPVSVFLRTADEVAAIAAEKPFTASQLEGTTGNVQVAMLQDTPGAAVRKRVLAHSSDEDHLAVVGRELFWLPRGGLTDAALDVTAVEKDLGAMTVRTMRTITRLAAKL